MLSIPELPQHKLVTLAKLTGGAAVLVVMALFISGAGDFSFFKQTAAVVCSSTAACTDAPGNGISITASSGRVAYGATTTLTWSSSGVTVLDTKNQITCFGDGTSCANSTVGTFALQTFGLDNAAGIETFTVGSDTYAAAISTTTSNDVTRIFKWIPASKCFGNGVACADVAGYYFLQTIGGGLRPGSIFSVGANTYAFSSGDVYKWMTTTVEGSPMLGANVSGGHTMFDRSFQLKNGNTVTKIGVYSTAAKSVTLKVGKYLGLSNFDVVFSQVLSHTGTGWEDLDITDFPIPASGVYYAGVYSLGGLSRTSANVPRSYVAGDRAVSLNQNFTDDIGQADAVRVTYSTPIGCFGNGGECANISPGENKFQDIISNSAGELVFTSALDGGATFALSGGSLYKWTTTSLESSSMPDVTLSGNYTMFDRSWQVNNGSTVTKIGVYSNVSHTVTVKIGKLINAGGKFDIVKSESFTHTGSGWEDFTLSTPYAVPATGTFYAGAYAISSLRTSVAVARSYQVGDIVGNSQSLTYNSGDITAARVTYATPISCLGNGVVCGEKLQDMGSQNSSRLLSFSSGSDKFFALVDSVGTQSHVYKWANTPVVSSPTPHSSVGGAGYTFFDRTFRVKNGSTVSKVGVYSVAAASLTVKIAKRNYVGNYTTVVSQAFAHPGGGWQDATLSTPYTVPSTGEYYAGVYSASNINITTSNINRAYFVGDSAGTQAFSEDVNNTLLVRVTYTAPIPCLGNGIVCATVDVGENAYQTVGGTFVAGEAFTPASEGTYVMLGLGAGLKSYIYKWANASVVASPSPHSSLSTAGYTLFDRTFRVKNGSVVSKIGVYSAAAASVTVKIAKRNYAGNYTTVVSQVFAHPGGGWQDATLSTPYTVPSTGEYYAGVYSTGSMNITTSNISRTYFAGNSAGTQAFVEDVNNTNPVRVTYTAPIPCLGNGIECATVDVGENAYQTVGTYYPLQWKALTSGTDTYLALAQQSNVDANGNLNGGGGPSSLYKWTSTYTEGSPTLGSANSVNYTFFDRSFQLKNSKTVSSIAVYSTVPGQSVYVKIAKRNGVGNYNIVASSGPHSHTGTGWEEFPISYTVPADGDYYAGTYASGNLKTTSLLVPRAYSAAGVNVLVSNNIAFSENSGNNHPAIRVTYTTPVSCLGNGVSCATLDADENIFQTIGSSLAFQWASFNSGFDTFLFLPDLNSAYAFKDTYSDCVGNGITCGTPLQNISSSKPNESDTFTYNGKYYLVVGNRGSSSKVYEWIQGSTCWGSGIVCGSYIQAFGSDGWNTAGLDVFQHVNGSYYVLMVNNDNNNMVYKWMPTGNGGKGCLGNDITCGSVLQSLGSGGNSNRHGDEFVMGGVQYIAIASSGDDSRVYKWMASGASCPVGGGFGDGTTCGAAWQWWGGGGWDTWNWQYFTPDSGVTHYLLSSNAGTESYVYKFGTTGTGCPAGGGFGAGGTAGCGNTQYKQAFGNSAWDSYQWTYFTDAGVHYMLLANYGQNDSYMYKWIPASTCFGNGTTCGTPFQTITINGGTASLDVMTIGAKQYLFAAARNSPSPLYVWMPLATPKPCWGNGSSCGKPLQSVETNTALDWEIYNIGGADYALVSNSSGGLTKNYKMMQVGSSGNTSPGCSVVVASASQPSGIFAVANSETTGIVTGELFEDTAYILACNTASGIVTASILVDVLPQGYVDPPIVSIASTQNATEGGANGTFTVTSNVATTSNTTIYYTVSGSASATSSADYTALSGSVVIPANQKTATVTVVPVDDLIFEGTETVKVTLSTNSNYTVAVSPSNSATLTIADNETSATVPAGVNCSGTVVPPACWLTITPTIVQKGSNATVTWGVTGLVTGANGNSGDTCAITANPVIAGFAPAFSIVSNAWSGTEQVAIQSKTIFTLTCTAPNTTTKTSVSKTINLVPSYQEL